MDLCWRGWHPLLLGSCSASCARLRPWAASLCHRCKSYSYNDLLHLGVTLLRSSDNGFATVKLSHGLLTSLTCLPLKVAGVAYTVAMLVLMLRQWRSAFCARPEDSRISSRVQVGVVVHPQRICQLLKDDLSAADEAWFVVPDKGRHVSKAEAPRCVPCSYFKDMSLLPGHFHRACPYCNVTGPILPHFCGPEGYCPIHYVLVIAASKNAMTLEAVVASRNNACGNYKILSWSGWWNNMWRILHKAM